MSYTARREYNMDEIWFILIKRKQEGPYSVTQLKKDNRITPDTYVWREGFSNWLPIRSVPELKEIFKDETKKPSPKDEDEEKKAADLKKIKLSGQDELTLDLKRDLPPIIIWIIIGLIILSYYLQKVFFSR